MSATLMNFLKQLPGTHSVPTALGAQQNGDAPAPPLAPVEAGPINNYGPPVPPEVTASLAKEQTAPVPPPEVNAVTGVNTTDNPLPPLDKLAASPGIGADQRPALAPPPKPHLGILDHIKQALPYIGAAGAAMAAAGKGQGETPEGPSILQHALDSQRAGAAAQREFEQIKKPESAAKVDLMSGKYDAAQKVAETKVAGSKDIATMNNTSKQQIAALQAGAGMVVQPEMAQIAGQPQLAGQTLSGKSLANFLKMYTATGAAIHDLGDEGMWSVDKAGNRIKRVTVSSPSVARANAFASAKAANTPVNVLDIDDNGNPILRAISQKQQLESGTPTAQTENSILGPTGDMRNKAAIAGRAKQTGQRVLEDLKDPNIASKIGPLIGRAGTLENAIGTAPPELAETMQDIKSFAQFVGGQHPVRGLNALEAFEKSIGGINQTPESLAAKIKSQLMTSDFVENQGIIKPNRPGAARKPAAQGGGTVPPAHTIQVGKQQYKYNGSGDTADMKNYTPLPAVK